MSAGTSIAGTTYNVQHTYDDLGQPKTLTYPDGEVVTYGYDASGTFSSLTSSLGGSYVATAQLKPFGAPASVTLGNGLTTDYGYDDRQRLHTLSTGLVQNLTLGYDDAGNVRTVSDAVAAESVTYGYDDLNRLTSASGFTGGATAAYSYDVIGNLRTKTEGTSSLTLAYPAPGQPRPHAVTGTTGTMARGFVYDRDGNQVTSGTNAAHGFDQEGRLSVALDVTPQAGVPVAPAGISCADNSGDGQVTFPDVTTINGAFGASPASAAYRAAYDLDGSGSITFADVLQENKAFGDTCPGVEQRYAYDADGHLVQRATGLVNQAAISWTNYGDGIYEVTSIGAVTKYYTALGRTIAMRKSGTLSYPLQDHLGSTVGMLDASGVLVSTQRYWPYGATRTTTGALATDKQYTGQQQESGDPALGLYDYKARFYGTVLGRFVSADTVADGLNRYAYVHDNPLRYDDPSGRCVKDSAGNWMPCSKEIQEQYFSCAWGGACDTHGLASDDDLHRYARGVIGTDAFKFFVAYTGDYTVHLQYEGKVHDILANFGHPITTGTVDLDVGIDAVSRKITSSGVDFTPGKGITVPVIKCVVSIVCYPSTKQIFGGWEEDYSRSFGINNDESALLHLEAGPVSGGNPFKYTGLYLTVDWRVSIDADGNPIYGDPSAVVSGPGSDLPIIDISLVLEDGSVTVY